MGKFMNFMISVMEAREKSVRNQLKLYYNIPESDEKLNTETGISSNKKNNLDNKGGSHRTMEV